MRYDNAYDDLTAGGIPHRKYAPEHWLTEVYFFGRRFGWRLHRVLCRNPLTLLWRGIRDGWEMSHD